MAGEAAALRILEEKFCTKLSELYQRKENLERVIMLSPALRLVPIFKTHNSEILDPIRILELLLKLLLEHKILEFEAQLGKFTKGTCTFKISFMQHCVKDFHHRVNEIVSFLRTNGGDTKKLESAVLLKDETELLKQSMEELIEMIQIQNKMNEEGKNPSLMNPKTYWNTLISRLFL